jgi:hypothetical protein
LTRNASGDYQLGKDENSAKAMFGDAFMVDIKLTHVGPAQWRLSDIELANITAALDALDEPERVRVYKSGELDQPEQGRFVAVRGHDDGKDQVWLYKTVSREPYARSGNSMPKRKGLYHVDKHVERIDPYTVLDWDVPMERVGAGYRLSDEENAELQALLNEAVLIH